MQDAPSKFNLPDLELLSNFLKNHKFVSLNFTEKVTYQLSSPEQKEFKFAKTQEFVFPPLNNQSEEEKQKIIEELEELKKSSKFFEKFTLTSKMSLGDFYKPIDLPLVYGDDEKFRVTTKKDEGLLLFFWKSECDACLGLMKKMGEFIEKFNGKLTIVSINVDRKKDLAINEVYQNNCWFSFDHYYLDQKKSALDDYDIDQLPYIMIFDIDKILKLACNPIGIELEALIEQVLKGEYKANSDKNVYKVFSQKMKKETLRIINDHGFDKITSNMTMSWKKQATYDLNGTMVSFNNETPKLTMKFNIKYSEAAKNVEEKIYALFEKGKETFSFVEIQARNPMEKIEAAATTIRALMNSSELKAMPLAYKTIEKFYWNQENQKFSTSKSQTFRSKKPWEKEKLDKFTTVTDTFNSSSNGFEINNDLPELAPIPVKDLFTGKEDVLMKEKNDQIILILWGADAGENQQLDYLIKLKERKANVWKDQVKYVYLVSDSADENAARKFAQQNKLQNISCYKMVGPENFNEIYGVESSHPALIVEKNGRVVDFLYESSNFKDVIQKSLEIKEPNDSLSKGDRRKVLKFLRDEDTMKTIGETFKSIDCQKEFELKIVKVVSFDEEAKKLPATFEVQIKTNIRKNDWDEKILPIWKKIFNDVPLTKFRTQLILSEALSIKKGSECHNCKKQFQPADPQYHCYECQLWFCEECGEKVDKNKKGSNSMIHPHNLIWIDVKEEKDIPLVDRYKLGDNRTYEDNVLQRGFGCNGCGEGSDKRVYICLNCRPGMLRSGGYIDICEECFKKLKKKEMNEEEKNARQMVVNRLKGDEHDENTHLLLRVCFGDNYYDF